MLQALAGWEIVQREHLATISKQRKEGQKSSPKAAEVSQSNLQEAGQHLHIAPRLKLQGEVRESVHG